MRAALRSSEVMSAQGLSTAGRPAEPFEVAVTN
jgi:hypothetical protein